MKDERKIHTTFSDEDIEGTNAELKVGILGTVNPEGLPHLTMISTLQVGSPTEVIWGQFTEGTSKQHIRDNPKAGFLIMSLEREFWRGKATWNRIERSGESFDMYNNQAMFRYNAYFGVHSVYFMDLVEHYGREVLPMGAVVGASVMTMLAAKLSGRREPEQVMNPWTRGLLDKVGDLKFLGFIGEDGYPQLIPVIQAATLDPEHVIFSTGAFTAELDAIPEGPAAIFGMSLDMEDVLVRGEFEGIRNVLGVRCGVLKVNWVYNPMPPTPRQIYPEVEIEAVRFQ
ncbi:MAG: hypothetical protein GTO18_14340 [Anaerolineales bacterium]|nr:hypothetical protein [Anaerolineales bacterium]